MQLWNHIKIAVLLGALLAPLVSTYIWYEKTEYRVKKKIKHQIIAGIDKEELVPLTFHVNDTLNQLEWKHSKEFKFQGEMYDIVERSFHQSKDSLTYWCWWDYEETALNKQLHKLVQLAMGQNPEKQQRTDHLIQFYKQLYNQANPHFNFNLFSLESSNYPEIRVHYQNRFLQKQVPPPRFYSHIS